MLRAPASNVTKDADVRLGATGSTSRLTVAGPVKFDGGAANRGHDKIGAIAYANLDKKGTQ